MVRYHMIAEGRVQGVGFRYFVQGKALDLNLTGYVRNLNDGSVEIEAQGSEEILQLFMQIIREGNNYISVHTLTQSEILIKDKERNFRISY